MPLTLFCSDARLGWPANLSIPAGSRTTTIPLHVTANPAVQGTRSPFIIVSAPGFTPTNVAATITESPDAVRAASPVVLSSAVASAARGTVTLTFTGALGTAAGDTAGYSLVVDGATTPPQSATLHGSNTVVLQFGALNPGESVAISYNLPDASGRRVQGTAKVLVK